MISQAYVQVIEIADSVLEQEEQEGFHMTVTVLHVVFHSLA